MNRHLAIVPLLAALGCQPKTPEPPAACTLTAAPLGAAVFGDANADGFVDVSDGMYMIRHGFLGGPAPVCPMAADVLTEDELNPGDGFAILSYLFSGGSSTLATDGTECPDATRAVEPACASGLAMGIRAESIVTGSGTASFQATVTLTSPTLEVEAWSVGVAAEGCTIEGATTAGTVAADVRDTPAGVRDGGYNWVSPVEPGWVGSANILSFKQHIVLPASSAPSDVLVVELSAPVGSACAPCTLSIVSDHMGANVPIEAVVSGGGYRYVPAVSGATVSICPG